MGLLNRLVGLFKQSRLERELNEELAHHIELKAQEYVQSGMSPQEARYAALRAFGGVEQRKEQCRDAARLRWVEDFIQDVRFGLRQLRRDHGFTAVAVITLAFGIGANTAIFSVVNGVLLAPLPYPQPARLVVIWETLPRTQHTVSISYPNFRDWQRDAHSFQDMAAVGYSDYELTNPGVPEHIWGMDISSGFFKTLGVRLAAGREFTPQEEKPGGARAAIISNRLWRDRFAGSRYVLGKAVDLNGIDHTIVGVAPLHFNLYGQATFGPSVYTPLGQFNPAYLNPRGIHAGLFSVARLGPGVSLAHAQVEMTTIQANLDRIYPDSDRGLGTKVVSLKQQIVGHTSEILLLLFGAVGLVLLIACANVANLLLARSAARSGEFAVRSALGASRGRVVRQLLTESTILAMAGGALGLVIAAWGVRLVLAVVQGSLPRSNDVGLNAPVLLVALTVAVVVGVMFGLAPALGSSHFNLQEELKEGGRTASSRRHRAQNTLVIFQMALTLVLLVGTGLLFHTIRHLWDTNPGFDARHVITFNVGLSPSAAKTGVATQRAYQQLVARIRQLPGVKAVGLTYVLPLTGDPNITPFWIGSQRPAVTQAAPRMMVFDTDPDYLRVMRIPLLRGRFFTRHDNLKSPCVAAIDSDFERIYFPNKDPIGQTLTFGWTPPIGPCRIVGVVGHVRHSGLSVPGTYRPDQSYIPLYQIPDKYWSEGHLGSMAILVRTPLDRAIMLPEIKKVVYGAGRQQTIYDVQTMEQVLSDSMWHRRFLMILLGIFAGLALLLASVGIYGVVSYSVTQRVHEIGIRMALGAERRDVFRMVIGQGFRLSFTGLAAGFAGALILTRALSSFSDLLDGVSASDPLTFALVSFLLISVALLACYIPARRATKVDPMVALRYE
jgi:predicted permease